ncbi:hypothetical protein [Rhizobium subbaraonis]|uniref:hypothetical protein n=1 Tax=Rhizobium subbaraonis TaxID=908946 RepID=UPI001142213C|nr:hypothetical protein [Rhizobium subbaraonis]
MPRIAHFGNRRRVNPACHLPFRLPAFVWRAGKRLTHTARANMLISLAQISGRGAAVDAGATLSPSLLLLLHHFFTKEGRRGRIFFAGDDRFSLGEIMESTAQKACWGLTCRMVIAFAGFFALVYLFGGA